MQAIFWDNIFQKRKLPLISFSSAFKFKVCSLYIVVHRFQYCLMYETVSYKLSMYGKNLEKLYWTFLIEWVSLEISKLIYWNVFEQVPEAQTHFLQLGPLKTYINQAALPRSLPDNTEIIEIIKTGKTGGKMCGCLISSNLI